MSMRPGFGKKPTLVVYEFDEQWKLLQRQIHHIDGLNYAHDFLLLEDYYVFHMTPFAGGSLKETLMIYAGLSSPGLHIKRCDEIGAALIIMCL